jgi:hypothetical protein
LQVTAQLALYSSPIMAALSPRFIALAALCYLASISLVSPAGAIAIGARGGYDSVVRSTRGGAPVIPLPPNASKPTRKTRTKSKESKSTGEKDKVESHSNF